jgi:tRNA A-37 threonylcarbamoyl transferase component Bud32
MGAVFRARDSRLHRDVALKVIHASLIRPEYVERFRREARAAAALNHPNVVAVFDVNVDAPLPYVVSELLDGESLRERLDRGPVPYRKALEYGIQMAQGLAAAHAKGICHRDVKPANVFVTPEGRVKLVDFGLAKVRLPPAPPESEDPTVPDLSGHGRALGTVGYMAPEQVVGGDVDHRADIFALGAVLYEMFTNVRAFQGASAAETMHAVLKDDPQDPLALNPSLAPAAASAVRRCLEKSPDERFQSARDLAFHLQQIAQPTTSSHPLLGAISPSRRMLAGGLAAATLAIAAGALAWLSWKPLPAPSFQQITFHRGRIGGARFAGEAIVYSQALALRPEVFLRLPGSPEARPLGFADADVLAARPGELALSVRRRFIGGERFVGTLAIAPLGGGAPNEVLEDVEDADFESAGNGFAIARAKGLRGSDLEYPVGRLLYRTSGSIHTPRVSRDGARIAFFEDGAGIGSGGRLVVVDREGRVVLRTREWPKARGLAWSAKGDEVWFTAAEARANRALRAVDLSGQLRLVHEAPGSLTLWDVKADGRAILSRDDERMAVLGAPPGEEAERDLSWFDTAGLASLSADGRMLLFGDRFGIYLRPTSGLPAVRLGQAEGYPDDLSPDGKQVLATSASTHEMFVIPTGPGQMRSIPVKGLQSFSGSQWFPDGRRILTTARAEGRRPRSYVVDAIDGTARAVTDEGTWALSLSVDAAWLAAVGAERGISLWPVSGGAAREIKGSQPGDRPVSWTSDGKGLWVFRRGEIPGHVYQLDIETGARKLHETLVPPDAAGVYSLDDLKITPSGHARFYSYRRTLSELYEVAGLR